jgi:hypothetical protein
MKVTIKSKYIHYGRQVEGKEIEVSKDETKMLDAIKVKYEIKEVKKNADDKV